MTKGELILIYCNTKYISLKNNKTYLFVLALTISAKVVLSLSHSNIDKRF